MYELRQNTRIDFESTGIAYDDLFFTKLVAASFIMQNKDLEQHHMPAIYLSGLLESYAKKTIDYMSADEYVSDLIIKIKENNQNSSNLKIQFADNVMFFHGLYPESFENSLIKPDFYISTARTFYIDVSSFPEQIHFELGSNITTYLTVLRQAKEIINGLSPDPDEKYLKYFQDIN